MENARETGVEILLANREEIIVEEGKKKSHVKNKSINQKSIDLRRAAIRRGCDLAYRPYCFVFEGMNENTWVREPLLWIGFGILLLIFSSAIASWLSSIIAARIAAKVSSLSTSLRAGETPIPVTLITGFLGAGKTTLLSAVLREPQGRRLAIIENEAGGVSVDASLLRGASFEGPLLLLANGCICCTSRGGADLDNLLDQLAALTQETGESDTAQHERRSRTRGGTERKRSRRRASSSAAPPSFDSLAESTDKERRGLSRIDAVAVELSGLADPAPLAHALAAIGARGGRFRLSHIITVVDASEEMSSAVEDTLLRSSQLAGADIVVINKVDASTSQRVSVAVAAAKVSAPLAAVETASMGGHNAAPPPPLAAASILGLSSSALTMATRLASLEKAVGTSASSSHALGAHARAPTVINLRPLRSTPMSATALESWASSVVRGLGGGDVLRMKGLIRVYARGPRRKEATALIQGVRTVLQVDYLPDSHAVAKDHEQLGIVIIGRHLDAKLIVDSWQNLR